MSAPIIEFQTSDGKTKKFAIGVMPARASFGVRVRLIRIAGEPIVRFLLGGRVIPQLLEAATERAKAGEEGAAAKPVQAEDVSFSELLAALSADPDLAGTVVNVLSTRLDPDELLSIADVVFASCRVDGKPMHGDMFDAAFSGLAPGAVEKVFFEALKVNYRNFFGAAS